MGPSGDSATVLSVVVLVMVKFSLDPVAEEPSPVPSELQYAKAAPPPMVASTAVVTMMRFLRPAVFATMSPQLVCGPVARVSGAARAFDRSSFSSDYQVATKSRSRFHQESSAVLATASREASG